MKATADAIADATRSLEARRSILKKEAAAIENELYRVEAAIKGIHDAFNLNRIRHKTRTKVCIVCSQEFTAKTDVAEICGKKACVSAKAKERKKGRTLLPGDALSKS